MLEEYLLPSTQSHLLLSVLFGLINNTLPSGLQAIMPMRCGTDRPLLKGTTTRKGAKTPSHAEKPSAQLHTGHLHLYGKGGSQCGPRRPLDLCTNAMCHSGLFLRWCLMSALSHCGKAPETASFKERFGLIVSQGSYITRTCPISSASLHWVPLSEVSVTHSIAPAAWDQAFHTHELWVTYQIQTTLSSGYILFQQ